MYIRHKFLTASVLILCGCIVGCALHSSAIARSAAAAQNKTAQTDKEQSSKMQLSTYLLFDGDCKQAMEFYHSILGGDLTVTTVGESPMKNVFPPSMHAKVVNARLKSATIDIAASDWLRPNQKRIQGNAVCLYLSGGTPAETTAIFRRLSEGADVTDALSEQPFGLYGALNDKFGIRWMFHANKQ
jgi:PhnB protein